MREIELSNDAPCYFQRNESIFREKIYDFRIESLSVEYA